MLAGLAALAVLAAVAVATTAAVGARAARPRRPGAADARAAGRARSRPGPIGAGPRAHARRSTGPWAGPQGAVPALALLPSTVASSGAAITCATSSRRSRASVSGIAAGDPYARGRGVAAVQRPARRARPAAGCSRRRCRSRCSRSRRGWATSARGAGVLVGFGLVALATLLVGLLEAMGRGRVGAGRGGVRGGGRGGDPRRRQRPVPRHRPGRRRRRWPSSSCCRPSIGLLVPPGAHPGHRAVDPMSGTARRQRGLILASAAVAGAIVLVTLLTTRGAERRRDAAATTLIPAYVPPHALVELVARLGAPAAARHQPAQRTRRRGRARPIARRCAPRSAPARACSATSTRPTARAPPRTSWPTSTATRRGTASTASSSTRPRSDVAQLRLLRRARPPRPRRRRRAGSSSSTPASCPRAGTSTSPT